MLWLIALLGKWMGPTLAKLVAWLIVIGMIVGACGALTYSVHHDGYVKGKDAMKPAIEAAQTETAKEKALRIVAENSNKTLLKALKDQNKNIEGWQTAAKSAQARATAAVKALDVEMKAHNADKVRLIGRLKQVLDSPDLPTAESCAEAAKIFDELATFKGAK